MRTYLRLLTYVRPYTAGMLLAVACMGILSVSTAAYAFLTGPLLGALVKTDTRALKPIADVFPPFAQVLERKDMAEILGLLPLVLLAVSLLKGCAYAGQFILARSIAQRVMGDLRAELFHKLLSLPVGFHESRKRGDLMARSISDVQQVEQSVTDASVEAVRHALQVVALVVQVFLIDWRLAALSFVTVPAIFWPVSRFGRFLKRVASEGQARVGQMTSMLQEMLHGIRVVQAFGQEEHARRQYADDTRRFVRLMDRSIVARGLYSPTMEMLGVVGVILLLRYVSQRMQNGELSPEVFISFLASMFLLYTPVKAIGKLSNYIVTGVASAERIFEILDAPQTVGERVAARPLLRAQGHVEFSKVRFAYGDEDVLKDVTLKVTAGEMVAVVGPSGAGKTTLSLLLPRFYDVSSGCVCVDGVDVREYRLADLRQQMALVGQDTVLFHATVRENIRYGRRDATDAQVLEAAQAAHAMEFIAGLPGGLDTLLGENGVNLSGGQRQRVAIARALVRNAPILVLDEATSALDAESEFQVQAALLNLLKGRTTLVIAHRLSTVRRADRIVVLEGGRVVEEGRHDELLLRGGTYARLTSHGERPVSDLATGALPQAH
jgi:subfamily B ATP-binding cassette protein MsbA